MGSLESDLQDTDRQMICTVHTYIELVCTCTCMQHGLGCDGMGWDGMMESAMAFCTNP